MGVGVNLRIDARNHALRNAGGGAAHGKAQRVHDAEEPWQVTREVEGDGRHANQFQHVHEGKVEIVCNAHYVADVLDGVLLPGDADREGVLDHVSVRYDVAFPAHLRYEAASRPRVLFRDLPR